jgi:hypothetical protein
MAGWLAGGSGDLGEEIGVGVKQLTEREREREREREERCKRNNKKILCYSL